MSMFPNFISSILLLQVLLTAVNSVKMVYSSICIEGILTDLNTDRQFLNILSLGNIGMDSVNVMLSDKSTDQSISLMHLA